MKRNAKRTIIILGLLVAALLAAASYFLYSFYVPDEQAEVLGNVHYTDAEIRRMAMPGFKEHNSLFLRFLRKEITLPDDPFIDTIEVEYLGPDRVRLHANEFWPVGYLLQDGRRFYFNASGVVTESAEDVSTQTPAEDTSVPAAAPDTADAEISSEAETGANAVESVSDPGAATDALKAESVHRGSADTEFRPALTDAALVSGLTDSTCVVGEQIQIDDAAVFQTLLAVGKLANKLNIHPDEIMIDPDRTMSLRYSEVLVDIGSDYMLEEKMSRAAAILPQLEGMKGTLHLENYTSGTVNIIFSAYKEPDPEEAAADPGIANEAGITDETWIAEEAEAAAEEWNAAEPGVTEGTENTEDPAVTEGTENTQETWNAEESVTDDIPWDETWDAIWGVGNEAAENG